MILICAQIKLRTNKEIAKL